MCIRDSEKKEVGVGNLLDAPPSRLGYVGEARRRLNDLPDWIISYVPPKIRRAVSERVEAIKRIVAAVDDEVEARQAIRGRYKVHTIKGEAGVGPEVFLPRKRPEVFRIL